MPEKNVKENGRTASLNQSIDYAVLKDMNLEKESIRQWLTRDLKNVYTTLAEVIQSQECIDALTEVFWKRYVAFHEKKKVSPELDLRETPNFSENDKS